jgi:hypothetical protein
MFRTSWPAETGCKADHAADQARTDNGSQETASRARVRAAKARLSRLRRGLIRVGQRDKGMGGRSSAEKRASRSGPALLRCADQLSISTGSPSGVRRMKVVAALASQ